MNIVAIGGGEIRQRETQKIDRFIRELSGKQAPNLLFMPTASYDAPGYCDIVSEIYAKELGCRYSDLKLITAPPSSAEIENQILNADIIYVGGGDTRNMLSVWQQFSIATLLEKAVRSGTILSGLSAGATCWHEYGHSDYESFTGKPDWQYKMLPALGFKKGMFCPHLDSKDRFDHFKAMVENKSVTGIGCDNNAAIWYQGDNEPTVVTSKPTASVRLLTSDSGTTNVSSYYHGDRISY